MNINYEHDATVKIHKANMPKLNYYNDYVYSYIKGSGSSR